ncbi:MAG: rhomboid family intramembrane serine protease [Deltaproteobacteria bacterium]
MDNAEQHFTLVSETPDYRTLNVWSLVLLSVNIPHRIEREGRNWQIWVEAEKASEAERQLAAYVRENMNWPPVKPEDAGRSISREVNTPPTVLLMGLLVLFHVVTGPWSWHSKWFRQGAVDLGPILHQGEWWRLFTALTLHADVVHLTGNVLIGGLVVHLLCLEIGSGLGWSLLVLAGAAGNYINLLWRHGQHLSIGFSTAVFGAVGLLCGLAVRRLVRLRELVVPLGAGLGLLAMVGTSGQHTDLGAHFCGLGAGFVLGVLLALIEKFFHWREKDSAIVLLPITLAFLVFCWYLALS